MRRLQLGMHNSPSSSETIAMNWIRASGGQYGELREVARLRLLIIRHSEKGLTGSGAVQFVPSWKPSSVQNSATAAFYGEFYPAVNAIKFRLRIAFFVLLSINEMHAAILYLFI